MSSQSINVMAVPEAPRARSAPDPVNIDLLVFRRLVVDDVRDAVDVEATSGDICRHQDIDLAGSKRAQRLLSGALAEVAVDGGCGKPSGEQVVGDLGGLSLGPGENHRQPAAAGLQDASEQLGLVQGMRPVGELVDVFGGRRGGVLLGPDLNRLIHEGAS